MTQSSDRNLDDAVIQALHKQDYKQVKHLIKKGANPNCKCKDEVSVLNHLIRDADDELLELLIERGADINCKDPWGDTPLIQSVRSDRQNLFELLIKLKADVNAANNEGKTALHYAVDLRKTKDMASELIKSGAAMNAKTKTGETPLMLAARRGIVPFADLLIRNGADINAKDNSGDATLKHAAFNGKLAMVKFLVNNGANINSVNRHRDTALYWAVCGGYFDVVKFLVDSGANYTLSNKEGETPFMRSASGLYKPGHVNILKFFIKLGVDIHQTNQDGITALMKSASGGNSEITMILLENGADANAKNARKETALIMACRPFNKGNPEVVKALIEYGANLDVKDHWKKSPLYLAAENGNTGIVKLLLEAGLDPDENSGWVLRTAVEHKNEGMVRVLLENGADVNLSDDSGKTALMIAVSRRFYAIAVMLIDAGANVNALSLPVYGSSDVSVLMYALGYSDAIEYERSTPPKISIDLIQLLLEKGADPKYVNIRGLSALDLADQKKDKRIVSMIKKRMNK